jgi:hypothetical protein
LIGIEGQYFSGFFGFVDFLVIFDNKSVSEVNKAGESVSLELETLLLLNDLKKGWDELLVVLLLGNWAELGKNEGNAAQSSVSDSKVSITESLASSLHGGVEVSL